MMDAVFINSGFQSISGGKANHPVPWRSKQTEIQDPHPWFLATLKSKECGCTGLSATHSCQMAHMLRVFVSERGQNRHSWCPHIRAGTEKAGITWIVRVDRAAEYSNSSVWRAGWCSGLTDTCPSPPPPHLYRLIGGDERQHQVEPWATGGGQKSASSGEQRIMQWH